REEYTAGRIRHSAFRTPHSALDELPGSCCFGLRRCVASGNSVLSSQAETGRETGVQHPAVAEVPGRDASQRAISTVAQELVADSATDSVDAGRLGARPTVL